MNRRREEDRPDRERFALRQAALSDSAAMAALMTQLGYATSPAQMSGRLERLLPHPEHAMVVAETSGEVIGMVTAQIGPRTGI